jgi:hypothetical protein
LAWLVKACSVASHFTTNIDRMHRLTAGHLLQSIRLATLASGSLMPTAKASLKNGIFLPNLLGPPLPSAAFRF